MTSRKQTDIDEAVNAALKEGHREFLRFLTRRTANLADAEDILQDFYLKVVQNSQTIRNRGSLRSWLAKVLRGTLADYYRKSAVAQRARQRLTVEEEIAMPSSDEAERAVCACLYRILPALPSQYSQVIWRVDLLGQPRSQVAKSLGISLNNLTVRIHRARHALKQALNRFCTTCPTHGYLNCSCEDAGRQAGASGRSARHSRKCNEIGMKPS